VTTNLIRHLYGDALLTFYIGAVSYYAETPYIMLGNRGDSEKAILVYFLLNGVNWILAAEFHYSVSGLKCYKIITFSPNLST